MTPPSDRLAVDVMNEINRLALDLVEVGLVDYYNPAVLRRAPDSVHVSTQVPVDSSVLRAGSYGELYDTQVKQSSFNFRFLDGAVAQLSYRLTGAELVTHRLCYLPSPDLEPYHVDPDLYRQSHPFLEAVREQAVSVPLRFDYDTRPGVAVSVDHPIAHLTLGQHLHCRIPVSGPITPSAFVDLVVRAFYGTESGSPLATRRSSLAGFAESITEEERRLAHLSLPRPGDR